MCTRARTCHGDKTGSAEPCPSAGWPGFLGCPSLSGAAADHLTARGAPFTLSEDCKRGHFPWSVEKPNDKVDWEISPRPREQE